MDFFNKVTKHSDDIKLIFIWFMLFLVFLSSRYCIGIKCFNTLNYVKNCELYTHTLYKKILLLHDRELGGKAVQIGYSN